jgi:nucleotide-binding universal stress UspA family protein
MTAFRSIAVAIDGSDSADRALESATSLAKLASAVLTIVGVAQAPVLYGGAGGAAVQILGAMRKDTEALLKKAADRARAAGVGSVSTEVREGLVVEELLRFLEERNPDLLVMGARGLSATGRLLVGSVSDGVVHHAHCSVLIVRAPADPAPTPDAGHPAPKRKT